MRAGLRNETFKYIEGVIRSYHDYQKWISEREAEIFNSPKIEIDENVGGGRSPYMTNETERIASKLILDRQLNGLREEYEAVHYIFTHSSDKTQEVIQLWYLDRPRKVTWDGVAEKVMYSKKHCQRLRDVFVFSVAERLGRI